MGPTHSTKSAHHAQDFPGPLDHSGGFSRHSHQSVWSLSALGLSSQVCAAAQDIVKDHRQNGARLFPPSRIRPHVRQLSVEQYPMLRGAVTCGGYNYLRRPRFERERSYWERHDRRSGMAKAKRRTWGPGGEERCRACGENAAAHQAHLLCVRCYAKWIKRQPRSRTTWGPNGFRQCRDCGHADRRHHAHGLCVPCYERRRWKKLPFCGPLPAPPRAAAPREIVPPRLSRRLWAMEIRQW